MAYRIRYGRKRRSWNIWKIQTVVAMWLGIWLFLAGFLFPGVKGLFSAEPSSAQQVWITGFAEGKGLRACAVAYCAAVLEQAGYG